VFPWIVDGVLLFVLAPALVVDLRERRIPDWVTFPGVLGGWVVWGGFWGWGVSSTSLPLQLLLLAGFALFLLLEERLPDRPLSALVLIGLGCLLWWGFKNWGFSATAPGLQTSLAGGVLAFLCFELFSLFSLFVDLWRLVRTPEEGDEPASAIGGGDVKLFGAVGALVGFPSALGVVFFVALAGGVQGVAAFLARTRPGRFVCRRIGMTGTDRPEFGATVPYGVAIVLGTTAFRLWQHAILWTQSQAP